MNFESACVQIIQKCIHLGDISTNTNHTFIGKHITSHERRYVKW